MIYLNRLTKVRELSGMSRGDIHRLTGVSVNSVRNLELGIIKNPTDTVKNNILKALKVSEEEYQSNEVFDLIKERFVKPPKAERVYKVIEPFRASANHNIKFGQSVCKARENLNLTQSELAGKIGESYNLIHACEKGVKPSVRLKNKLVEFFGDLSNA